jgi:exodeoxyribonuclease V beta subunit
MTARIPFDIFNTAIEHCNLIEASAGTGKTWSLTGLYLRIVVEKNLLPENILVVTYTKAATAELNGRIRSRLHSALLWLDGKCSQEDKEFLEALFSSWKSHYPDTVVRQRLINALSSFDKAAIFTIHSFCQRLLNDYAFEAGNRFNLIPVTDTSEQLETVVYDFWRQHLNEFSQDKGWITWLVENKQSPMDWLKAVTDHKSKPYQIIFEPEEAEIEVDIQSSEQEITRICKEFEKTKEKLKTLQIKCLDLWRENSKEIISCFKKSLEQGDLKAGSYKIDDLEKYQQSLISLLENELIPKSKITILEKKFCQKEIESKVKNNCIAPAHDFFSLMDDFVEIHTRFNEEKKSIVKLEKELSKAKDAIYQLQLQKELCELLIYIDKKFPELKLAQGIIDFDDMILNVYHALKGTQGHSFAKAVSQQFSAALIDEFQDTDPLQFEIFSQLFVQTNTPLFYVGDPKQAIYSFRGADIHAYYQAAQAADSQLTLMKNYRSTPQMVDSINALFSPQYNSFISEHIVFDWVESTEKEQFIVEDDSDDQDKALQFFIAQSEDGTPFTRSVADPMAVVHTVEQIAQLLEKARNGKAYFKSKQGEVRPLKPKDIAILVPRHKDGDALHSALSLRGIASVRQGRDKVLDSQAASTMLRLVRAVAEPGQESYLLELLGDPLIGTNAFDIFQLKDNVRDWENLIEFFWDLRKAWIESGFSTMFRQWLDTPDKETLRLSERLMNFMDGERHLTDLMHLAEILQQQSRYSVGIQPLISWLQHAMDGQSSDDEYQLRLESDSERVKIVTLHACKGLEYDLVFCPFLWAGTMPKKESIISAHKDDKALVDFGSEYFNDHFMMANEESLMEQLRLLYVALTRPVHRCYVFWAHVQYNQWIYTANSALAWLLYADGSMLAEGSIQADGSQADNVCEQLRNKVRAMSFDDIVKGVEDFCASAGSRQPENVTHNFASVGYEIVSNITGQTKTEERLNFEEEDPKKLDIATVSDRQYSPGWFQTSFSALVKDQHVTLSEHADDLPLESDIKSENPSIDIFSFPRGALPGECIHSIYEHWDFCNTDEALLNELVARELDRFSVDKVDERIQWIQPVSKMVMNTLNNPLNKEGFCLAKLTAENRQAEMEFLISARGSIHGLQNVFKEHQHSLPKDFVEACKQIDSRIINGFLTGFIDLIFKDEQGRYCVLDWKSNHLGMQSGEYGQKPMERAMASHHYYLQALVYLVALHRYLTHSLSNYDMGQHLGGAWYLFVRGIDEHSAFDENGMNGVYHFQPGLELIKDLDKALLPSEKSK